MAKWPRIQKKAIAIVWKKILSVNEDIDLFLLVGESVATLLWPSVGVKPNTWKKSEDLESFGTPECSEVDIKAQNTSHWGVLGVIGKVLKRRCKKWPCIGHLDICSPSYGQKNRVFGPPRVTEYTIGSMVVAYSRVRAVVCLVVQSARGLSQHPKVSRIVN